MVLKIRAALRNVTLSEKDHEVCKAAFKYLAELYKSLLEKLQEYAEISKCEETSELENVHH